MSSSIWIQRLKVVVLSLSVFSGIAATANTSSGNPETASAETLKERSTFDFIQENFGLNYNSFFSGPGFGQPVGLPPGMTGEPSDTGLNFLNLISVKWKVSENIGIDVQFRNQVVVTQQLEYRHQGQRFGISGTLLKGDTWSLSGAFNSDVPIAAIMGQINTQRTLLLSPGLFSIFSWQPKGSRWSVFSLVAPRIWFYRDRQAVAIQDSLNGGTVNKPEYTIYLNPSINYAVTDKIGLRLGTILEYTKFVGFSSIRRAYMPMEFGVTYDISDALSIYPYVQSSTPLDDNLRSDQGFGNNPWTRTLSFNVWLSGKLF